MVLSWRVSKAESFYWNDRAEVIFGYSRHEVLGQSLDIIIPIEMRKAHWEAFNRAISEGRTKSSGQAMTTNISDRK